MDMELITAPVMKLRIEPDGAVSHQNHLHPHAIHVNSFMANKILSDSDKTQLVKKCVHAVYSLLVLGLA